LESGLTPATVIDDEPLAYYNDGRDWRLFAGATDQFSLQFATAPFAENKDFKIWVPNNFDGKFMGKLTLRRGIELSHVARWSEEWRTQLSITAMRARYDQSFVSGSGAATVPSGSRLPGTPERSAFAEIAYTPRWWAGFNAAVEVVHVGRLYVDDANDDSAPAATVMNLRAGWKQRWGALEIEPLFRIDNATDRRYAGSVIVNEANRRFFEPAPTRNWLVSVTARYRF
jgi:iron complex outermembrane receptor protein